MSDCGLEQQNLSTTLHRSGGEKWLMGDPTRNTYKWVSEKDEENWTEWKSDQSKRKINWERGRDCQKKMRQKNSDRDRQNGVEPQLKAFICAVKMSVDTDSICIHTSA